MLHFIVSNGNGVVMGETVISLITRYWKQLVTPLFPSLLVSVSLGCFQHGSPLPQLGLLLHGLQVDLHWW